MDDDDDDERDPCKNGFSLPDDLRRADQQPVATRNSNGTLYDDGRTGVTTGPDGECFGASWVQQKHDEIQKTIQKNGIASIQWKELLDQWSEHIKDVPYEDVSIESAKEILRHARLTKASASPMFYEMLRRLGGDILSQETQVVEELLDQLKPADEDSDFYHSFYGKTDNERV